MQRNLKSLFFALIIFSLFLGSVHAEDGAYTQLVYLPLVSNEKYTNPWLGPDGGFVVNMVTNPTISKIFYAGTWGNGVFKSIDGGITWMKSSIGLGDLYINSLAIDPQNPNILYAGTYNDEIYKSIDAGYSWFHSSQGIQDYSVVYTIAIDPYNPDIIYIGTRGKDVLDPPPWKGIVYRSVNEGINWSPVLENVGGSGQQDWAYDIVVNPKNHCMVFVAMHEYGVYRSLNCGDSWLSMNDDGLTDQSGRALAINPNGIDGDALYYGTWHRTGVYKSTNNGDTWNNQFLNSKIYSMDIDPRQPEVLYLADFYEGVLKTSNGGNSWSNIGLGENLIYSVMVNPLQHSQIFVGTAGNGIFRSEESGANWMHSQRGLINSLITGIQVNPTQSDQIFASTSRGGFHSSQNSGESWEQHNNGLFDLDARGLVLHPQNPNQVYLWTYSGGLFTCTLPDCTWKQKNIGLPTMDLSANSIVAFFPQNELENEIIINEKDILDAETKSVSYQALNDFKFFSNNPARVYLATNANGVYRSTNGTDSWSPAGLSGKNVHKLEIHPINSEIVYASIFNSSLVYTTSNSGGSWSSSQVPGGIVNDLEVSVAQPGIIYSATNGGVYRRSGSEAWQLVGLAGKVITALAIHPMDPNLIIAGGQGAVYYSKDGGVNWIIGPADLSTMTVKTIEFDPEKVDFVYLGSSTQGIYRLLLK